MKDIKSLVDHKVKLTPALKVHGYLYTRMTASVVRRQLIAQCGYTDEELPTSETIKIVGR